MQKSVLIIPTRNGGEKFRLLLESLNVQTYQPQKRLVIDTSSDDNTVELAKFYGFEVLSIDPREFNHGATRQWGVELYSEYDVVIFFTQDTILADEESLEKLLDCFKDSQVGAAYGRQLPHHGAGIIATHARMFNYPEDSMVKSMADVSRLGIKTAFCSNSFAAYRQIALKAVGGFPTGVIFGEDTYVAAKMLLAGWKISYCAAAKVYHSHDYKWIQEFKRYIDIGVFHAREPWFIKSFGRVAGEGRRFFISEINFVRRHNFLLLGAVLLRTALKLAGYQLGWKERYLLPFFKRELSMRATNVSRVSKKC